eukprot:IDg14837t1
MSFFKLINVHKIFFVLFLPCLRNSSTAWFIAESVADVRSSQLTAEMCRAPSLMSKLELEGKKSLSNSLSMSSDDDESSLGSSGFLSAFVE